MTLPIAPESKPVSVLILEDNMLIGAHLAQQLSRIGCHVLDFVPSPEEALEWIAYDPPDLLVMDIRLLNDPDGIETAFRIRASYVIPIVFVTALPRASIEPRIKFLDHICIVAKPFTRHQLEEALEQLAG